MSRKSKDLNDCQAETEQLLSADRFCRVTQVFKTLHGTSKSGSCSYFDYTKSKTFCHS